MLSKLIDSSSLIVFVARCRITLLSLLIRYFKLVVSINMEMQQSSGVTVIESSKPKIDYMINYKLVHSLFLSCRVDDSMSPLHLFFRDHTGTIFTIILIVVCYFAILFPEPVSTWLSSFLTLHGAIVTEDGIAYEKDIKDICTVVGLTVGLTVLRYFLCHTLFRLIAEWLHIEDTLEKPQLVHKTEAGVSCIHHP